MRVGKLKDLSLRLKISVILALVGVLLLTNVVAVWIFLDQQNHDGAIIDRAGRQRMLVQEMTIQAHYIAMGNDEYREDLATTAAEYDRTLTVLIESDPSSDVPPPPPQVRRELVEAEAEWEPFFQRVQTIAREPRDDEDFSAAVSYLQNNNQVLLSETDDTVQAYERSFERKVARLRGVLAFLAGLDFVIIGFLYTMTEFRVIRPMNQLSSVTAKIADGDHDRVIPQLERADEVGTLTRSVASMKEQLVASLRRARGFERAVEHAGAAIYLTDTDGTIEYVNPAFERQTGYSSEEAIGSNPRILKSGEHSRSFYRSLWNTITDGNVWEGEITNARRNGERYQIEQTIAPILDDDEIEQFVAVNHDITELKELEARIRQERDKFAALFENISEPVVEVRFEEQTAIVCDVNSAFVDRFGIEKAEILNECLDDHIAPDDLKEEASRLNQQCLQDGQIERTVERDTASGTRTFLLRSAQTTVNGRIHCFGIYLDITDRIEQRRQLQRQNERLQEFASVLSHDLRNPLNVAIGGVELVMEDHQSEYLDRSYSAMHRMASMIDDILELAREGAPITDPEAVDLSMVASEAWTMVNTRDVDASVDIAENLGSPLGDRNRCLRLFENLFRNAIEHGSMNGAVMVTVEPLTQGRGFSVADDGPGIPPEEREKVLQPGYSTGADGTGFGLKIVQEIAEAHGWELRITESQPGGAKFEFHTAPETRLSSTVEDPVTPSNDSS